MATPIQMPVRNASAMTGVQQANALGVQSLAGQMTQKAVQLPSIKQAAQQVGAAQATATGQQQAQVAQQASQQASDVGRLNLQAQQNVAQNTAALRKVALDKQGLTNQAKLANMSSDAKQELFDKNMQFKRDEAGRAYFNERQAADWAVTKAKTAEEFENYKQRAEQAYDRQAAILDALHKRLAQELENETRKSIQDTNQEYTKQLYEYKQRIKEAQRKAAAKKSKSGAIWSAAGTVMTAAGGVMVMSGVLAPVGAGAMVAGSAASAYGAQQQQKASTQEQTAASI